MPLPPDGPGRPQPSSEKFVKEEQVNRLLTVANIQYRRGQTAEAEKQLRDLLAINENHAAAHELLADILLARGDYDGAQRSLRTAIASDPNRATAESKLARAVLKRTEEQRKDSVGAAYAGSQTPFMRRGGAQGQAWLPLAASVVIPGAGQLMTGDTVKGSVMVGVDILGLIVLGIFATIHSGSRRSSLLVSPAVWIALGPLIAVWIYALVDLVLESKRA